LLPFVIIGRTVVLATTDITTLLAMESRHHDKSAKIQANGIRWSCNSSPGFSASFDASSSLFSSALARCTFNIVSRVLQHGSSIFSLGMGI